jgi:hypothetical protein
MARFIPLIAVLAACTDTSSRPVKLAAAPSTGNLVVAGYNVDSGVSTTLATDSAGELVLSSQPPLLSGTAPSTGNLVSAGYSIFTGNPTDLATDNAGQLILSTLTPAPNDNGTPTFLYVTVDGGLDTNPCTFAAPCLTIQAACNQIPQVVRHWYDITVEPGTYSAGCYLPSPSFQIGNYIPGDAGQGPFVKIHGVLGAYVPDAGIASGAVTSATQGGSGQIIGAGSPGGVPGPTNYGTLTSTGAGWADGGLAGALVKITGGPGAGEFARINTNSSSQIVIDGMWPMNVTPTSASTFSILSPQAGGTKITGVLPKPAGATGYAFSASAAGASFFVSSPGSQDFIGYGSQRSTAPYNASFASDPEISIDGFYFALPADTGSAVAISGPEVVGVRFNDFAYGGLTDISIQNGSVWIESNNMALPDQAAIFGAGWLEPLGGLNNVMMWGNYATSTHGNYLTSGSFQEQIAAFNHVAGAGHGLLFAGNGTTFSTGNDWVSGSGYVIDSNYGSFSETPSIAAHIYIDGDSFTSCTLPINVGGPGTLELVGDPIVGSVATTLVTAVHGSRIEVTSAPTIYTVNGFSLATGANLHLEGHSIAGFGDGGSDILVDGTGYSYAYLTNDGGIFGNLSPTPSAASLINYVGGAINNLATGSAAFK